MERSDPAGELVSAHVLDASGAVIEQVRLVRIPLSHAGSAFLYVPPPAARWSALRIGPRTLRLSEVLPPLQPPSR